MYIKKLNRSSKTITSNVNKYNLLKMEHRLIQELKNRILDKIKTNENIESRQIKNISYIFNIIIYYILD